MDRLKDTRKPVKVQLKNIKQRKKLYQSPEMFNTLITRKKKLRSNPFKMEVFSLGMIILECGL